MTTTVSTIIIVLLLGLAAYILISQYLKKKAKQERQFDIFIILMSTRAYAVTREDAETLEVELEFSSDKNEERDVLDAWEQYLSFLDRENESKEFPENKRINLLIDLLQKMALVLNYNLDKNYIKETCHSQIPAENFDEHQMKIRQEMIEMLESG